ncbi:hypothetical protein ACTXT7_016054 [Hymenolepis weldensis]
MADLHAFNGNERLNKFNNLLSMYSSAELEVMGSMPISKWNGQPHWLNLADKEVAKFEFRTRGVPWCYISIQDLKFCMTVLDGLGTDPRCAN